MANDQLYVVIWKAYGVWKCTTKMWVSKVRAQEHIDRRLSREDYNQHITIVPIELPLDTGPVLNEDVER